MTSCILCRCEVQVHTRVPVCHLLLIIRLIAETNEISCRVPSPFSAMIATDLPLLLVRLWPAVRATEQSRLHAALGCLITSRGGEPMALCRLELCIYAKAIPV